MFEDIKSKSLNLRTTNWFDPHQGYIGNLPKLLDATTNK